MEGREEWGCRGSVWKRPCCGQPERRVRLGEFGFEFEGWLGFGEGVVFAKGHGGVVHVLLWFLLRCACSAGILMDDDHRVGLFLGVGRYRFHQREKGV